MFQSIGAKISALGNQGVALAVILAGIAGFAAGHYYKVSGRRIVSSKGGDLGK
jgi:Na+-driven multidrug efflux pump